MKANVGVVLDAGVFIALERRNRVLVALVNRFVKTDTPLVTSAGVVAQVWRGGAERQAPLAYLLQHTTVLPLDYPVAKILGRMLGASGSADPVDAHLALLARQRNWPVLTSDPDDLLAIDPTLVVERVRAE
ncbi:MAG TPA: PIN domain-containing protein [Polyangiaceae bacterium]|nr:PIN domain-containing protein [Polyangiaceae bacterium]